MIRLLLDHGVELGDSLLHAIEEENVVAVEMLLQAHDQKREKQTVDAENKVKVRSEAVHSSYYVSCDLSVTVSVIFRHLYQ